LRFGSVRPLGGIVATGRVLELLDELRGLVPTELAGRLTLGEPQRATRISEVRVAGVGEEGCRRP
jgi:hypothetical protein